MRVAFSGHRPEKMPFAESMDDRNYIAFRVITKKVIRRLAERGAEWFISGMAQGFDTWAAEDVLELKLTDPGIKLDCAIPYPRQASGWSEPYRLRRQRILDKCDQSEVLCPSYSNICFFVRNRYMVDNADVLVCAYDGKSGGTSYTLDYALKSGKVVININPRTREVSFIGSKRLEDIL